MKPLDEADEMQHEAFDKYISSRVCLPRGDNMAYGTVRSRKKGRDGNLIGRSNSNPLNDTSIYEVEFDSGETEAYTANLIAESIYSRMDADGTVRYNLVEVIDHKRSDSAIPKAEGFTYKRDRKIPKRTTRGWALCVQWNDGSTTWESLRDMHDSDPLQVAEYARANQLLNEPAFAWWAPKALR